jgi:uncharacterized repeat protein (TIGR01451 family)
LVILAWSLSRAVPTLDLAASGPAGGAATVYPSQVTIGTWNYADFLHTKYDSAYNMSYQALRWSEYREQDSKAPRTYETIVIENDYLAATIIPELGGRVYSLVFKPTGSNEFYSNNTVKPTEWGPPQQGWWLAAGGMEWCLPVEEHGYEWGIRWQAETGVDGEGAYVTLRDTTANDRLRARIVVRIPHDKAYLSVSPTIENPTDAGIWYKYWTNVQVAPGPANTLSADFHFILPTDEVTVHSTGDARLPGSGGTMTWPRYKGLNWDRLGTWNQWFGFFARPQAQADFMGGYDHAIDEGVVRVFPPDLARGAKGFAWGWNNAYPAHHWTDGTPTWYAELHGGIAPTFWDSAYLPPATALGWTEFWYPVAGIGGVSVANASAALYLDVEADSVMVGVQPTGAQPQGRVALCKSASTAPLLSTMTDLSPATPLKTVLAPGGDLADLTLAYLGRDGQLLATTGDEIEVGPPQASVDPLPSYVTAVDELIVSWSGTDAKSCVIEYDVQVRDGYDGSWTDWLTRTTALSANYGAAVDGHTYFFRARARDLYGNVGAYGDEEWGQAFTSLLLLPAPVLVTSRKGVDRAAALPGEVLTYTLSLRNTGSVDAAGAAVTDTLPAEVALLTDTLRIDAGPAPTWSGNQVSWVGTIPVGTRRELVFAGRVLSDTVIDLHAVTNAMYVTHGETRFQRQASFLIGYDYAFPCVYRNGAP